MLKKVLSEFKTFAMRGNMVDLAIGIVVGAAFTGIVNSLVTDIITPPIGLALGGLDFTNYFFVLSGDGPFTTLAEAQKAGAVTLNYGAFFNAVLKFLIVAITLFLVVRQLNRLLAPRTTPPVVEPPPPPEQIQLLQQIRDLLAKK